MKLVIDNLLKKYDEKIAVEKISFEVNQGETIGILGPNGAGKTTLFYMIAGLINPDSGIYF
jgi:ABC-type lipopolysaccharide export system ATPase subunit